MATTTLVVQVQGWTKTQPNAFATVNGQRYELQDLRAKGPSILTADFATVDRLHLTVASGRHTRSLCDTQDVLFFLFGNFANSQLRELNVRIDVDMPDSSADKVLYATLHPENASVTCHDHVNEFREIERGDISRLHATAFLTDPMRVIRGLKDGRKVGKLSLVYAGDTQDPWKSMKPAIRDLVRSNIPIPEYDMFRECYSHLREVCALLESLMKEDWKELRNIRHEMTLFAVNRIRGDVVGFEAQYAKFITSVRRLFELCRAQSGNIQLEQTIREIEFKMITLEKLIPSLDADVSFLGYNMANEMLPEKQGEGEERQERLRVTRRWLQG